MNGNTWKLVKWPAVIALGVTILRLAGEFHGGSAVLFSREPGGAFALVGIVWLVPIFGIYFGMKLTREGRGPATIGRAAGMAGAGIVVVFIGFVLGSLIFGQIPDAWLLGWVNVIVAPAAVVVAAQGWKALSKVLICYGLLSRLPVVIIMFLALRGVWGTHYEGLPPDYQSLGWFSDWIVIGVLPQFGFWIAFTALIGGLFGALGAAIAAKK